MSIPTMNWALSQRLETHAQQILLYVIADSTDPAGVTRHCDPEYMAKHARMTRATMFRRLGELEELGLLKRYKFYSEKGAPIYEIRLDLTARIDLPLKRRRAADDDGPEEDDGGQEPADTTSPESHGETLAESHGETLVETAVSPQASPQSHSCDRICPPVSQESPPNPPPGGGLSKAEAKQSWKHHALWDQFVAGYPGIARMDQLAARIEFDRLSVDDAEWAVSVLPSLKEELRKPKSPPPRNAHLWLRKAMFKNFPKAKIEPPPPDEVWITEGSDEDRALRFVCGLAKKPVPFVRTRADGTRGYTRPAEVGADLLAMLTFERENDLRWPAWPRGSAEFAAWQSRFTQWVARGLPIEPGSDCIRAPCQWPPKKDGTIYRDAPETSPEGEDHDRTGAA
jgi:hypothetical protein